MRNVIKDASCYPLRLPYQQGIAAIWMAMLLVPIMGFVILAVEGTRYIQEKSRVEDATETAVFALTLEDNRVPTTVLAEAYIGAYAREAHTLHVKVSSEVLAANPALQIPERVHYTVLAETGYRSWFHSDVIPSFPEEQTVTGRSEARARHR